MRITPSKRSRAKRRAQAKITKAVREYVFAREEGMCRCCGSRRAESMHEIRPRSLGGKVSPGNSIAVCGDGVRGCHGLLQRHEIIVESCSLTDGPDAERTIVFWPNNQRAKDWLEAKVAR